MRRWEYEKERTAFAERGDFLPLLCRVPRTARVGCAGWLFRPSGANGNEAARRSGDQKANSEARKRARREACGGHGGLPQARVRERCGRGEAHFVGRAALRVGARKAGFDNGIGYQMPERRRT